MSKKILLSLCAVFLSTISSNVFSVALHSSEFPPDRPVDLVVGRWQGNASYVMVARDWILTTRHQGGAPSTMNINGQVYNCHYNSEWEGGPAGVNADIRLIRLTKPDGTRPNLPFAPPYEFADERNQECVIGGYGLGVIGDLTSQGVNYGYSLDIAGGNSTLEWGKNIIDGYAVMNDMAGRTSDIVYAYFNGPDSPKAIDYEGMPTLYDSGCPWFILTEDGWKVAALSRSCEYHSTYEVCWYKNPTTLRDDPDFFEGVRVSSYAAWINDTIAQYETYPPDYSNDYCVDAMDFGIFVSNWNRTDCENDEWCNGADCNQDGTVNEVDLCDFANYWLATKAPPS